MTTYRCRSCGDCFASDKPDPVHKCGGRGYPRNHISTEVFMFWKDDEDAAI